MGRRRVIIAGGGIAALEAAVALRTLAGDRVQVTLIATNTHMEYRPLAVGLPFGRSERVGVALDAVAARNGFAVHRERVQAVDLHEQLITTETGPRPYDDLILALGATPAAAVSGALTFRGPQDADRLADALVEIDAGGGGRIVFAARTVDSWMLPLYELALLTSTWARERSMDVELTVVTPERSPLEVLGATVGPDLLADRGIRHIAALPEGTVPGGLWVPQHGRVPADLIVAMPVLTCLDLPGLPQGRLGFVEVDDFCRVTGFEHAYAVGDMTARRVRQGGLAAQQADVAAACIAADAGVPGITRRPYAPRLDASLFVGDAPAPWGPDKMFARYLTPQLAAGHLCEGLP
jgi:sulfide:quinone oxidoreductase